MASSQRKGLRPPSLPSTNEKRREENGIHELSTEKAFPLRKRAANSSVGSVRVGVVVLLEPQSAVATRPRPGLVEVDEHLRMA